DLPPGIDAVEPGETGAQGGEGPQQHDIALFRAVTGRHHLLQELRQALVELLRKHRHRRRRRLLLLVIVLRGATPIAVSAVAAAPGSRRRKLPGRSIPRPASRGSALRRPRGRNVYPGLL